MVPESRILFLYMVPQTGHQQAAQAIMEAADHIDPGVTCVGVDAAHHAYPVIGHVFNRMYLEMLKRAPLIWDYLYDNPDVEVLTRDARGLLTLISSFRTKKIIRQHRPGAIVCTQAIPAIAMAAEKKRGHLNVPLVGVITDFGVHAYWLHPEIDHYMVGHEEVKNEMIRRGIRKEKIHVTGIPISPKFGETHNAREERKKLKLSNRRKTILIMGGSHGLGSLQEIVTLLKSRPTHPQALIVCGKNKSLQKKMESLARGHPEFQVHGYIKDLSGLMSAAHVLVSKPGGLTCSEALARQLPIVLTNPIPGQEERNVRFLTQHNVALAASTPSDVVQTVEDLLKHPAQLANMKKGAQAISRPRSAWQSAQLLFDFMYGYGHAEPIISGI